MSLPKSLADRLTDCAFISWCLILFSLSCSALQAIPLQGLFLLYLKNFQGAPFTQANVNTYPLGIQAVGIVSELVAAYYLDKTGHRIRTGIAICTIQMVCAIILVIPNVPFAAAFFAFYASGTAYAVNPLLYGWANIICIRYGDDAKRGVVLASMVGTGIILWTFWGIVMYPATDSPYWKKGYIAMMCVSVAMSSVLFLVKWVSHTSRSQLLLRSRCVAPY
jgi:ACS family pantothenate transporter-like MFS transporter